MNSMLDNAYSEFDVLQDKIQKLESQVAGSQKVNLNFIDAQEEIMKLTRMLEEEKEKYTVVYTEKLQMEEEFRETEEKLREANSQRQHMQKQIAYLEELNMDLQSVADLNSSLQSQIKRIGELESMIQMLSEERRK
jgi:chromosome segregation ATPase